MALIGIIAFLGLGFAAQPLEAGAGDLRDENAAESIDGPARQPVPFRVDQSIAVRIPRDDLAAER